MCTTVPVPREAVCTTSNPGTSRRASNTVSACLVRISSAVITVADVVTWSRGVSVRVAVTNTGGRVASGGSAAGNSKNEDNKKNRKRKQTFMETLLLPRKGTVKANG